MSAEMALSRRLRHLHPPPRQSPLPPDIGARMCKAIRAGVDFAAESFNPLPLPRFQNDLRDALRETAGPRLPTEAQSLVTGAFYFGVERAVLMSEGPFPPATISHGCRFGAMAQHEFTKALLFVSEGERRTLFGLGKKVGVNPSIWSAMLTGAMGVAVLAQAIQDNGWRAYLPTPEDDVRDKVDLVASSSVAWGEGGFLFQVKGNGTHGELQYAAARDLAPTDPEAARLLRGAHRILDGSRHRWLIVKVEIGLQKVIPGSMSGCRHHIRRLRDLLYGHRCDAAYAEGA